MYKMAGDQIDEITRYIFLEDPLEKADMIFIPGCPRPEHTEEAAPEQPEPEVVSEERPVSVPREPAAERYYSNAGVGRKESPYADSPYVMNHQQSYGYEKPQKVKKQKKTRKPMGKFWKGLGAAVLALILVGGTCAASVAITNHNWYKKTAAMNTEYRQQLEALEKRLEKAEKAAASQNNSSVIIGDAVAASSGLTASQVYAMNVHSVVAISNRAITTNVYGQETEMAASGSGFII